MGTGAIEHVAETYHSYNIYCTTCTDIVIDVKLQDNLQEIHITFPIEISISGFVGTATTPSTELCNHILSDQDEVKYGTNP